MAMFIPLAEGAAEVGAGSAAAAGTAEGAGAAGGAGGGGFLRNVLSSLQFGNSKSGPKGGQGDGTSDGEGWQHS